MANNKKGRRQALKDISNECPLKATYNEVGKIEVLTVTASHLDTKKTRYLNKQLGL